VEGKKVLLFAPSGQQLHSKEYNKSYCRKEILDNKTKEKKKLKKKKKKVVEKIQSLRKL
jgi:hypothetical protein